MPRDVKVKEGQCFQGGTGLTSLALSLVKARRSSFLLLIRSRFLKIGSSDVIPDTPFVNEWHQGNHSIRGYKCVCRYQSEGTTSGLPVIRPESLASINRLWQGKLSILKTIL